MSGFALKAVIIAIVIALLAVIVLRAFRRVTPGKAAAAAPLRQRMPMLFALIGAWWLSRSAIAPVAAIAAEAQAIQGHIGDQRITTHADIVELKGLIDVLNGMLSRASADTVIGRMRRIANEFTELHHADAHLPLGERRPATLVLAIRPWELEAFQDLKRKRPASKPDRSLPKR